MHNLASEKGISYIDIIIITIFISTIATMIWINIPHAISKKENFKSELNYQPANFNKVLITDIKKDTRLENPEESDVVNYDNYVCYKKNTTKSDKTTNPENNIKDDIPNKVNVCKNKSITEMRKTGKNKIGANLTCSQQDWDQVDPSRYYKIYHAQPALLNDPKLKGFNIEKYSTYANIYEIGKINLDTKNKYPKANNYYF